MDAEFLKALFQDYTTVKMNQATDLLATPLGVAPITTVETQCMPLPADSDSSNSDVIKDIRQWPAVADECTLYRWQLYLYSDSTHKTLVMTKA